MGQSLIITQSKKKKPPPGTISVTSFPVLKNVFTTTSGRPLMEYTRSGPALVLQPLVLQQTHWLHIHVFGHVPVHKGVPDVSTHPGWTVPNGQKVTQYWHTRQARAGPTRGGWKRNESVRRQRWGLKGLDDNRSWATRRLRCVSSLYPCCFLKFGHDTWGIWTAASSGFKKKKEGAPHSLSKHMAGQPVSNAIYM